MNENFKNLPKEIQTKIKEILKAYDKIDVYFEDNQYHFGGICIKKSYAKDHKNIGTFYAKDIFTNNERMENYINEFFCYPIEYQGERDLKILKQMENEQKFDFNKNTVLRWIGRINNNGNFELIEKRILKI